MPRAGNLDPVSKLAGTLTKLNEAKLESAALDVMAGARGEIRKATRASTGIPRSTYMTEVLSRSQGVRSQDPDDLAKLLELYKVLPRAPWGTRKELTARITEEAQSVEADYLTWKEVRKLKKMAVGRQWLDRTKKTRDLDRASRQGVKERPEKHGMEYELHHQSKRQRSSSTAAMPPSSLVTPAQPSSAAISSARAGSPPARNTAASPAAHLRASMQPHALLAVDPDHSALSSPTLVAHRHSSTRPSARAPKSLHRARLFLRCLEPKHQTWSG